MKPVGLTFKDYRVNPFTNRSGGELMVIHLCLGCGKIATNRIAGDDNEYQLLSMLDESENLNKDIISKLKNIGVEILTQKDKEETLIALFGYNYKQSMPLCLRDNHPTCAKATT
jgi:hypothetical protein